MTTIAYDGESIAVDQRLVLGNQIASENFDKSITIDGITYFVSGVWSDVCYLPPVHRGPTEADIDGFFYDPNRDRVMNFITQDGMWFVQEAMPKSAVGSGGDYAVAAMRLGKDAKEAVEFASTLDIYTGKTAVIGFNKNRLT